MATLLVVSDGGRRESIKVASSTTLAQVLQQVCSKWKLNPDTYFLVTSSGIELDLSLPFRLSGLAPGQKLSLNRKNISSTNSSVTIVIQTPIGERLQHEFATSTTLLSILQYWQDVKKIKLKEPDTVSVFLFMQREFSEDVMSSTTLSQMGITSGNALFRLLQKKQFSTTTSTTNVNINTRDLPNSTITPTQMQTEPTMPIDVSMPTEIEKTATQISQLNNVDSHQNSETVSQLTSEPLSNDRQSISGTTPHAKDFDSSSERNVQVLAPTENAIDPRQLQLPDKFYDVTRDDLLQIAQQNLRKNEESSVLKTKAMREKEKLGSSYQRQKTLIRVRFPDKVQVQCEFLPTETPKHISQSIIPLLQHPDAPFYLYTTPPPQQLDDNLSLEQLHLHPFSVVHFAWKKGSTSPTAYLKPEYYSSMQMLPLNDQTFTSSNSESVHSKEANITSTTASTRSSGSSGAGAKPKWFLSGQKKK